MNQDDLPPAPSSVSEAIASEYKSVYQDNMKAGFTPRQALYLLAVQMTNSPGPAPDPYGEGNEQNDRI